MRGSTPPLAVATPVLRQLANSRVIITHIEQIILVVRSNKRIAKPFDAAPSDVTALVHDEKGSASNFLNQRQRTILICSIPIGVDSSTQTIDRIYQR